MKILIISLLLLPFLLNGQAPIKDFACHYAFDYSDSTGWTQTGSLVEISNNKVNFIDGAPDGSYSSISVGIQRRLSFNLGTTFNSMDTWTVDFDFTPMEVGTHSNGNYHTGHNLFSLSENDNDPFNDCNDLPCSGFPQGSQDAISLVYATDNPPSGDIHFSIRAKDNGVETGSDLIFSNTLGNTYYLRLTRENSTIIKLNVYTDAARTTHLTGSPISFTIPSTITGLTTIQHGNIVRGQVERELTGNIDNLCIIQNNIVAIGENYLDTKNVISMYDYLGREIDDLTNYQGYVISLYSDGSVRRSFHLLK